MTGDQIELETKLAMLERTVDTLSGELLQHAQTIASMQQQIRLIVEQLRPKAEPELGPHDSPPPHYRGC